MSRDKAVATAIEDSLAMLLEGASIKETAIRLAWALGIDPDKKLYQLDSIKKKGGYYSSWNCLSCGGDHGGPGCENPDFGKWHQWYEIEGLVEVGKEDTE